jgi:hypothetical protein
MTRLDLLKRVQKRKKQIGLTIDNIAKLSNLGNRTITRFQVMKYLAQGKPYTRLFLWLCFVPVHLY